MIFNTIDTYTEEQKNSIKKIIQRLWISSENMDLTILSNQQWVMQYIQTLVEITQYKNRTIQYYDNDCIDDITSELCLMLPDFKFYENYIRDIFNIEDKSLWIVQFNSNLEIYQFDYSCKKNNVSEHIIQYK